LILPRHISVIAYIVAQREIKYEITYKLRQTKATEESTFGSKTFDWLLSDMNIQ